MHSHTFGKARCAAAHVSEKDSPDNSSARSRQAVQANDRRVLDVLLEERLQSRTSELLAWAKTDKTMLPVINQSVRDARAQLHTGHQDIRTYFSKATVAAALTHLPSRAQLVPMFSSRYSAAFSEPTNQDGHAFLGHPPVSSWYRQRHLNPSDTKQQRAYTT
jgi:hypothetical protein